MQVLYYRDAMMILCAIRLFLVCCCAPLRPGSNECLGVTSLSGRHGGCGYRATAYHGRGITLYGYGLANLPPASHQPRPGVALGLHMHEEEPVITESPRNPSRQPTTINALKRPLNNARNDANTAAVSTIVPVLHQTV